MPAAPRFPVWRAALALLFAAVLLLSRYPLLHGGYGSDDDAWRSVVSALHMRESGHYVPSRIPGYPLFEFLLVFLVPFGPFATNLASVLAQLAAADSFRRGVGHRDPDHGLRLRPGVPAGLLRSPALRPSGSRGRPARARRRMPPEHRARGAAGARLPGRSGPALRRQHCDHVRLRLRSGGPGAVPPGAGASRSARPGRTARLPHRPLLRSPGGGARRRRVPVREARCRGAGAGAPGRDPGARAPPSTAQRLAARRARIRALLRGPARGPLPGHPP